MFLHDETQYEQFWCPFCGIQLFAVLIYEPVDAELAKSPHFKKPKGVDYHHGCDGNPAKSGNARGSSEPAWKVEKQPFILPTRLVEYIEPLVRGGPAQPVPSPTVVEVKKRRAEAGAHHHRARFSVALVQSVAEAHLGIIGHAYKQQKEKKWSDKQRKDWLSRIFDTEIDLRGATMKYREALHDLYYPVRGTPRIYHGEGIVTATDGGYVITAARPGRVSDEDKVGRTFNVVVRIDGGPARLRGARRELIAQLQRAATQQFPVRWYAYGLPTRTDERFEVRVNTDNLSDLFIRRKPGGASATRAEQRQASAVATPAPAIGASARAHNPHAARSHASTTSFTHQEVERRQPTHVPSTRSVQQEHKPIVQAPPVPTIVEHVEETVNSSRIEADTRQIASSKAIEQEYDAYLTELAEAARKNAADFRKLKLEPHIKRKPLLWGRSAWKAALAEFENVDRRNNDQLERLTRRELTPDEIRLAKEEAKKRVSRKRPELST
ncbi:hypothetical protein [Burkholderia pseudomallei]|uniref:hypothetical protein n=1 Tax=Burkholderia pseudomallei TaxID=28450 RepID=UPI002954DE57|nr:hypothetical protein [Burkholderia pseudomallei]